MCNICKNGCFVGVCECKCHQEAQVKDSWEERFDEKFEKELETTEIPSYIATQLKSFISEEIKKAEAKGFDEGQQNARVHYYEKVRREAFKEGAMEVIQELTSNPNKDGSISPNIQHWIEQKQLQLKAKFVKEVE